MSDLLQMLSSTLGGTTARQVSSQLGTDPQQTQQAIGAALPLLLGALARNANKSPEDARALAGALERDHDGSLLDNLGGLLGALGGSGGSGSGAGALLGTLLGGGAAAPAPRPRAADGDGILRHVLGDRRPAVEQGVARATGLDAGQVGQLLATLAPVVMGALGKAKRQQDLDADGVAALLNRERATLEERTPGMQQGGLLGLLDRDGDGNVADDIAQIGGALGGLFGK